MRYVTNEQRRRETLFKPSLWAVASWLIFRVAHSLHIDSDVLVVRTLKISQLAMAKVFRTPLAAAAWRSKPSWGIVAGADQIINPDLEKWYYNRARSHWIVVEGFGHDVYEARPTTVDSIIEQAAQGAGK